jgi:hypothetical protein
MPKAKKFGPRAMKVLRHLLTNPYATQGELLALIRPEFVLNLDWEAATQEEVRLKRYLNESELDRFMTVHASPSKRWGCSYFRPCTSGYYYDRASLIVRGVIAISPVRRGRCKTYVITPLGMAVLARAVG